MLETYNRIEDLCRKKGINITQMCQYAGVPRANLSDYKAGRKKALGLSTLTKIANYFDISVDYLVGNEKTPDVKPSVSDDDIKFALFGGDGGVSDAQYEEVKRFAQFIKERDQDTRK